MIPIWAWARRELARERRAALALVLLVGISGAVVLTERGRRPSHRERVRAVPRGEQHGRRAVPVLERTEDVDDEVLAALHADPDVEQAAPLYLTVGFAEGVDYDLGIFAGPDPALFHEMEIPKILEGRLPDPSDPNEVMINRFTQSILDVEPGDVVTVATFGADQFGGDEDVFVEPAGPTLELEVTGHRRAGLRPRRPGVHRVLRDARVP